MSANGTSGQFTQCSDSVAFGAKRTLREPRPYAKEGFASIACLLDLPGALIFSGLGASMFCKTNSVASNAHCAIAYVLDWPRGPSDKLRKRNVVRDVLALD